MMYTQSLLLTIKSVLQNDQQIVYSIILETNWHRHNPKLILIFIVAEQKNE